MILIRVALLNLLIATVGFGASIDYRVFSLSGDVASVSPDQLIALCNEQIIFPTLSGSVKIKADGEFTADQTISLNYPQDFSSDGKV